MTNYLNANLSLFSFFFYSMQSPNQNKGIPHKHNKDTDDMYIILPGFTGLCVQRYMSVVFYMQLNHHHHHNVQTVVICGLGSLEFWNRLQSNLQVWTGSCRKRCWRGSGSYVCPLQTVTKQLLIFVSHNQLKSAHFITSHNNRVISLQMSM